MKAGGYGHSAREPMTDEKLPPSLLSLPDGGHVAYRFAPGRTPTVVFLCGYASEMTGAKARFLHRACAKAGHAYLRFDYRGRGASSGRFEDGTIGSWTDDACAVIEAVTRGPLVLVGSSMGGWIMLLVARRAPERVRALVGVAPAPDFTEDGIWPRMSENERETLATRGIIPRAERVLRRSLPDHVAPHRGRARAVAVAGPDPPRFARSASSTAGATTTCPGGRRFGWPRDCARATSRWRSSATAITDFRETRTWRASLAR